jgi:lipoprotein-anchoring transpeptidase ErfK/SrfK
MRFSPRPVLAVSTITLVGLFGLNAALVQLDAASLRSALDREQSQGVPAAQLESLRGQLAQRTTPAGSLTSVAVAGTPYADLMREAEAIFQAANDRSRQNAQDTLSHLSGLRGGPASDYAGERAAIQSASTPAGFDLLASRWTLEAETATLERQTLADLSGGLTDGGRPQDISDLGSRIDSAIAAATSAQVDTDPAPAARDALAAYWPLGISDQLAQHDELKATLTGAADSVQRRADAKKQAQLLAGSIDDLIATAGTIGVPDDIAAAAARGKAAAPTAHTDAEVTAAVTDLQTATDALNAIINRAASAPLPACLANRPAGQTIIIHTLTQQLVAYQDGCPWLAVPVTTGRPALPTDVGTWHVFYKAPAYKMISPWPPGSPFWYPNTWVYNAMEFVGDGTFIHNADWQPDSTYGPGSNYGPYASHGCVHVQDGPLAQLYAWTQLGATVIVEG